MRGSRNYIFAGISIAIIIAIAAGIIFWRTSVSNRSQTALASDLQEDSYTVPELRVIAEGALLYENKQYHFSLLIPKGLSGREYKEAGGAMTVSFEKEDSLDGFQVFVTPYKEAQITDARFKMDVPSGVMKEPTDIIVDGVKATMFYSTNSIMGETREVWFIKDGLLYEVVTYKDLDEWLSNIMQSWKFI